MTNIKYDVEPQVLLDRIREEYLKARKVLFIKDASSNLKRGKSRNIDGIGEDLVADFIRLNLADIKDAFVFVNQPLSLNKSTTKPQNKRRQPIYPDIAICKKIDDNSFEIRYIIDLKMDAGHLGNLEKVCTTHDGEIQDIINDKVKRSLDGEDKNIQYKFEIDKNKIWYDVVIVSAENRGKSKAFQEKIQRVHSNKNIKTPMQVLMLLNKGHLNDYNNKQYKINDDDFATMISRARESVK